jgi:tRNA A37 threonylcarbamoyladenosine dehydratase
MTKNPESNCPLPGQGHKQEQQQQQDQESHIQERRFGGVARLYGDDGLQAFLGAHVLVAGLGGVGSWALEALVRSGVGEITLMDFDHIAPSNVNRQLHATQENFGKSKVQAMAERLVSINPQIKLHLIDEFLTVNNLSEYLGPHIGNPLFVVLDATDDVKMKIALAAYCEGRRNSKELNEPIIQKMKAQKIPLILCGGAGGKLDPSRIQATDLSKTTQDPVLSKIRYALRKQYGFSADAKKKLGITAIYSDEPRQGVASGGLACSGYGSAVTVTATFGFVAAAEALKIIKASYLKQR